MQTAVWNDPNLDTNPPRQTCTISSSLTFTLTEARESQISLIQACKESDMILVQWKRCVLCLCMCEKKEMREEKYEIDKYK